MKIYINKKERDSLWFILYQFIDTHHDNGVHGQNIKDVESANSVLAKLKFKKHDLK